MSDADGIVVVDTGFLRPRFDACYLVVEAGRAAFIDCGTPHSVPALLAALADQGLGPEAVDWLILTHVHLDHAGGAGALMRRLPSARLAVHPRGLPHMIDPSTLVAGATQVYGEAVMARDYGTIVPVPAERAMAVADGQVLELAGRPLACAHTPGHARHHLCVWDQRSRCWFTGDTLGVSYREFDSARGAFAVPTTSPVQFEPEPLKASIRLLQARRPAGAYVTHFGRVDQVDAVAQALIEQIDAMVGFARQAHDQAAAEGGERHDRLRAHLAEYYLQRARAHGSRLDRAQALAVLDGDIELNAQGLGVWLDREHARAGRAGA